MDGTSVTIQETSQLRSTFAFLVLIFLAVTIVSKMAPIPLPIHHLSRNCADKQNTDFSHQLKIAPWAVLRGQKRLLSQQGQGERQQTSS
jgi:hypothetical protein